MMQVICTAVVPFEFRNPCHIEEFHFLERKKEFWGFLNTLRKNVTKI